jgi:hypothetical protein
MKKTGAVLLCMSVLLAGGCGRTAETEDTAGETQDETATAAPDEWVSYDTLEAAEEQAGFTVTDPGFTGYESLAYAYNAGQEILEIRYESGDDAVVIRKGTGIRDVSGITDEFDKEENGEQNGHDIFVKKNNDLAQLAIWHDDTSSYSLYISTGSDEQDFLAKTAAIS